MPVVSAFDLDFDFLGYRRFQCSECHAVVAITHYNVYHLGEGQADDVVECLGDAESA